MKLYYQHHLNSFARKLRQEGNLSEALLWNELKHNKLGCRFLRQRPIGSYIVDFYCHALNLAIEIDGAASHDNKIDRDARRQRALESFGVRIIRLRDADVRYNLQSVIVAIKSEILRLAQISRPLASPKPSVARRRSGSGGRRAQRRSGTLFKKEGTAK